MHAKKKKHPAQRPEGGGVEDGERRKGQKGDRATSDSRNKSNTEMAYIILWTYSHKQ